MKPQKCQRFGYAFSYKMLHILVLSLLITDLYQQVSATSHNNKFTSKKRTRKNLDLLRYNVENMYQFNNTVNASHGPRDKNAFKVVNLSEFVAKVKGGLAAANKLAEKLNFKLKREVFPNSNLYVFEKETVRTDINQESAINHGRRVRRSIDLNDMQALVNEPMVT